MLQHHSTPVHIWRHDWEYALSMLSSSWKITMGCWVALRNWDKDSLLRAWFDHFDACLQMCRRITPAPGWESMASLCWVPNDWLHEVWAMSPKVEHLFPWTSTLRYTEYTWLDLDSWMVPQDDDRNGFLDACQQRHAIFTYLYPNHIHNSTSACRLADCHTLNCYNMLSITCNL